MARRHIDRIATRGSRNPIATGLLAGAAIGGLMSATPSFGGTKQKRGESDDDYSVRAHNNKEVDRQRYWSGLPGRMSGGAVGGALLGGALGTYIASARNLAHRV